MRNARHTLLLGVLGALVHRASSAPPQMTPPSTDNVIVEDSARPLVDNSGAKLPVYPASWTTRNLRQPVLPVFDATILHRPDAVALVGGFTAALETTPAMQIYNPARGWQPIGSQLRISRARHTMTPLGDGRMLIVGGVTGSLTGKLSPVLECEVVDPLKAGSILVEPLDEPILGHTAHALDDGRVAVVGGGAVRIFDVDSMQWTHRIALRKSRRFHASVLTPKKRLLVIAGDQEGTIEMIDLSDPGNAVSTLWNDTLQRPLIESSAVSVGDDRVILVGGVDQSTGRSLDTTWILDVASQTIETGPPLLIDGGIATPHVFLRDGLVVILGGEWVTSDDRGAANATRIIEIRNHRRWALRPLPTDAARRMWYQTSRGEIGAFGGYRFITPDDAARTGAMPGLVVVSDHVQLRVSRVPIFSD